MADQTTGVIVAGRIPRRVNLREILSKLRTWPIVPVFLLSLVLVAGVAAPWIAPHDPDRGILRERNLPLFWSGMKPHSRPWLRVSPWKSRASL